jgi:hypothetical protein
MSTTMVRTIHLSLSAVAVAAVLAGCQLGSYPVLERWPPPQGEWQVVSHKSTGVSAMSPVTAAKHVGGTVLFGSAGVVSGNDKCSLPTYVVTTIHAEPYLYRQYGVRTADLGIYPYQSVRVTEVFCDGKKWPALGGHVVWVEPDRGYAIRDGIWFELRRAGTPER